MTDTRHALAERDTSKPAEKQGLFDKFKVLRRDGSSEPGEKHDGREYFVLDIDHDPHAKAALAAYADDVEATHPYLAKDMRARYALSAQPVAGAVAEPTLPVEIYGKFYEVPIPVQVHIVALKQKVAPAPEPSAQAVREPGDPLHDDAYVRGVAVGFVEDDSRRTTLLRIADRMQKLAASPQPAPSAQGELVRQADDRGDMAMRDWHRECDDADTILRALGLDPVNCRTDGGSLKTGMILGALQARDRILQRAAPSTPPPAVVERSDVMNQAADLIAATLSCELTASNRARLNKAHNLLAGTHSVAHAVAHAVVEAVPPLGDAEAVYIIRTTPMGGSIRERDVNLVRAAFDVGVTAAEAHHGIAPKAAQDKP